MKMIYFVRNLNRIDVNLLQEDIDQCNFEDICTVHDIDEKFDKFYDTQFTIFSINILEKKIIWF